MRIIYLIFTFSLLQFSVFGQEKINNTDTIIGKVVNYKRGAAIISNDTVYMIGSLNYWNSNYTDKEVMVIGNIKIIEHTPNKNNNSSIYPQQVSYPWTEYRIMNPQFPGYVSNKCKH